MTALFLLITAIHLIFGAYAQTVELVGVVVVGGDAQRHPGVSVTSFLFEFTLWNLEE